MMMLPEHIDHIWKEAASCHFAPEMGIWFDRDLGAPV